MDSSIQQDGRFPLEEEPASSGGRIGEPSPSASPQQGGTLEVGGNTRFLLAGLGTQTRHRWPAGGAPSQVPPAELIVTGLKVMRWKEDRKEA